MVKNLPATVGDMGLIPGLKRSPGGGNDNPLQYSCLENPIDRGAWWATYSPWGHKESDRSEYTLRHSFMGEDFRQLMFHIGLFQTADYFLIFHGMQIK